MKYVTSEEIVCDYSSWHPYKDLLKVSELNHDVNFVSDDATQNALATDIIKKARQN